MPFVIFSRSIRAEQWLIAMGAFVLFALSFNALWQLIPAQPPVRLVGQATGELLPNGRWRVTRTLSRSAICGSEVWTRIFRTSEGDQRLYAVASTNGNALEPTTTGSASRLGTVELWWEYEPVKGWHGSYNVVLSAGWCANGYSDVEAVYVVPFDWRNIP